jgi:signal transduction histidine kinase
VDRSDARHELASSNPWNRLEAARSLARTALPDDIDLLQEALRSERVPWVQQALREALARATQPPPLVSEPDDIVETIDAIYARAVRETSARLVHELRTILGSIRLFAEREVRSYETSRTKGELDKLADALRAIDSLAHAATSPLVSEFDAAALHTEIAAAVSAVQGIKVLTAGPTPHLINSDKALVELVVRNAVTNAAEASPGTPVVLNWGETDRDYWVAVLDDGSGLPHDRTQLFRIGTSTKQGHIGIGLATALTAARSLRGVVSLDPREPRGARFEFRWPKSMLR